MLYRFSLEERHQFVAASKLLGTFLRSKPSEFSLQPFFEILEQGALPHVWPAGTPEELEDVQVKLLSHPRNKELDLLWQNMMMGPEHLQAPPWGSVYLDHEQVVFGESCIELAFFLKKVGIYLDTGMNEPEDHIGLMFWYIAGLLEEENEEALITLLQNHLLPWSHRYTHLFYASAPHPFFEGVAILFELSLNALQNHYHITPTRKRLYF